MGKGSLGLWLLILAAGLRAATPASPAAAMELWCVAKNNAADAALQAALDWACGAGGADCTPIQQGGPCFVASDVQSMASYAFNAYFLKNAMANHSCYFDNSAALTSLDPSHDKCKFPSSVGVSGGTTASPSTATTTTVGFGPSEDMSGVGDLRIPKHLFLLPILCLASIQRVLNVNFW